MKHGELMGYEAKKTEHCGAKRGRGAYYGHKWEAKKESNRIRRENWKREIRATLNDSTQPTAVRKIDDRGRGPDTTFEDP